MIVVGAGPVGLAAAIELAGRGCRVRVIEQADRIGRQPRAKTTNVRSMEHLRRWGLAGQVRAAAPLPPDHPNRVVFATGMFGRAIADFTNCFNADPVRDPRYPEPAQWIPQYEIERLLHAHAQSLPGCTISFATALESLRQDDGGVTVHLADGAHLRGRYLIGADGAHSRVRDALGVTMQGDARLAKSLTLVLRLPGLSARHPLGDALMYWLIDPQVPAVMGPMDRDDVWFWGSPIPPDARMSETEIAALVAKSLGPDTRFEILASDFWIARRLQADRYGAGRVWLAGDACHLHPPFGGHGMNLGIGDAVDLGWKIAATLQGWGGPALLPSYETERRPVHQAVIAEAVENMASLGQHFASPLLHADDEAGEKARQAAAAAIHAAKDREFHSLPVVLGVAYHSDLVINDGHPMPIGNDPAQPIAGGRAPHAWLADGHSLFDRFGPDFTLLQLAPGDPSALLSTMQARNIAISHLHLDDSELTRQYGAAFTLIRPDQHIAWLGDSAADLTPLLPRIFGLAQG